MTYEKELEDLREKVQQWYLAKKKFAKLTTADYAVEDFELCKNELSKAEAALSRRCREWVGMKLKGHKILWCTDTINPIQDAIKGKSGLGYHCTKISPGCNHCYAERINNRFGNRLPFDRRKAEFEVVKSELQKPVHWKKPRRIFWQSMGDLFHDDVPFSLVKIIFDKILYEYPNRLTHIFLTKRPKRMKEYFCEHVPRPLNNVHIGVTAETQEQADKRIPVLLQIPAAVRFVSVEPMLGPVDISQTVTYWDDPSAGIKWVICGGESGPKARPVHPDWIRSLRDQCQASGIPFFFKHWGEYVYSVPSDEESAKSHLITNKGVFYKVGKKAAGRILDGRTWEQVPKSA